MHNIQLKFIAFSFWKNSFIVHVFFVLIFIEVQLIYNIVNATGVHQSFQILFWYKSLKSIEQSSLCYAVGPYQLSILYLVVCICQSQFPNCPSTSYPQETMFVFYIGKYTAVFQASLFEPIYQIPHISDIMICGLKIY